MKEFTTLGYSRELGITKAALLKRLKKGGTAMLPGCKEVKVFPRQTIFVVDYQAMKKSLKKVA